MESRREKRRPATGESVLLLEDADALIDEGEGERGMGGGGAHAGRPTRDVGHPMVGGTCGGGGDWWGWGNGWWVWGGGSVEGLDTCPHTPQPEGDGGESSVWGGGGGGWGLKGSVIRGLNEAQDATYSNRTQTVTRGFT